ncbi:MAG: iron complex transport system substrate-binding protein [Pirellulaceae bacterium]|jgi:iron complex transport system substrate-binding protein
MLATRKWCCAFALSLLVAAGCDNPSKIAPVAIGDAWYVATDDLNREVPLAKSPQRIISLTPANTEMLFAVGAGDKVVGVTTFCNFPPEAQQRTKVGGFLSKSINRETLLSLKPDLVLAGRSHDGILKDLNKFGIPTLILEPQSLQDILRVTESIGNITDRKEQAEQVTSAFRVRLQRVRTAVSTLQAEDVRTVYYEVWNRPLTTAGQGSFIHELIVEAGGKNIFADLDSPFPRVSEESLLVRNPSVILAPTSASTDNKKALMLARSAWSNINAIVNKDVHFIDEDIVSRPGPRVIDALEAMVTAIYPQLDLGDIAPSRGSTE